MKGHNKVVLLSKWNCCFTDRKHFNDQVSSVISRNVECQRACFPFLNIAVYRIYTRAVWILRNGTRPSTCSENLLIYCAIHVENKQRRVLLGTADSRRRPSLDSSCCHGRMTHLVRVTLTDRWRAWFPTRAMVGVFSLGGLPLLQFIVCGCINRRCVCVLMWTNTRHSIPFSSIFSARLVPIQNLNEI